MTWKVLELGYKLGFIYAWCRFTSSLVSIYAISSHSIHLSLLQLGDLKNSLSEVLACEQTKQTLAGVVDALGNGHSWLVGTLVNPLLHVLLVLDEVLGAHVLVTNDESLDLQALGNNLHEVADRVPVGRRGVVLRNHTTGDDAAEVVHGVDCGFKVLASNVLVVNVNAVWCQSLEAVCWLLLLVVEGAVEAKLFVKVLELLVIADGSDNLQTLVLGQLSDELTNSTGSSADEDGLALLGLTNSIETAVGGQTGHSESTGEDLGVDLQRVVKDAEAASLCFFYYTVFLAVLHTNDDIASLELGVVGFQDGAHAVVGDWLAEGESW